MQVTLLFLVAGAVLIFMAVAGSVLQRLPLTGAIVYLAVGFGIGPFGLGLIKLDPVRDSVLLEHVTEIAVIISLFTVGLKLRIPLRDPNWYLPVRLAFVAMALTVGLVALVGVVALGLPVGTAILLGAVLAPTDPVLASDVQLTDPWDRDRVRFALTGEGALNDGTAFPLVVLGLGLLGLHELGDYGWRWWTVDLLWAVVGGLAIGAVLGILVGRLILYIRRQHREAIGLDNFLALGLIALSYGAALLVQTYGFLAVFAAGLALRHIELHFTGAEPPEEIKQLPAHLPAEELATHPEKAPAYMAQSLLGFNEQIERIGEVAVVVLLGSMLSERCFTVEIYWFIPLLLLVIRPVCVWLGLIGAPLPRDEKLLVAWFGIRGIGSLYYLAYAISHHLPTELAERLTAVTLAVVTVSIIVHGIAVTPLMKLYESTR